jgi:hypothetical protein
VRSSTRSNVATGVAFATVGFRVARTP